MGKKGGFGYARNAIRLYSVDSLGSGALPFFACFAEVAMPTRFKIFAIVAALAAGTSSAAMAQYACPPGYAFNRGVCQPVPTSPYPSNPVSGAVSGEAAGAASGYSAGGP